MVKTGILRCCKPDGFSRVYVQAGHAENCSVGIFRPLHEGHFRTLMFVGADAIEKGVDIGLDTKGVWKLYSAISIQVR